MQADPDPAAALSALRELVQAIDGTKARHYWMHDVHCPALSARQEECTCSLHAVRERLDAALARARELTTGGT